MDSRLYFSEKLTHFFCFQIIFSKSSKWLLQCFPNLFLELWKKSPTFLGIVFFNPRLKYQYLGIRKIWFSKTDHRSTSEGFHRTLENYLNIRQFSPQIWDYTVHYFDTHTSWSQLFFIFFIFFLPNSSNMTIATLPRVFAMALENFPRNW